jgi:hypothetical protein
MMSSSMLEQAVIDAQSLKEAAIKNAEREILEKYSSDVKQAVDALLEQDEVDPMAGMANNEPDEMIGDINLKATEGETACPCPDEQEVVTIDLSGIVDALRDEPEEEEVDMSAMAEPAPEGEELETDLEALAEMLDLEEKLSDKQEKVMDQDKDGDIDEKDLEALRAKKKETNEEVELKEEELDEDIELTEENILEIMEDILSEKLTVDMSVEARGDLGTTHPTLPQQEYAMDVAAAEMECDDAEEDNKALNKALKKIMGLEEHVSSLKLENNKLGSDYKELKSLAKQVSDKLVDLNVSNAKLVYENRVLKSDSLNERQKQQIVESISNARSIEEAKVIYETLQHNLKSVKNTAPRNLSEAVSKNNSLVLKSKKETKQVNNSAMDRMRRLAGITK